MTVEEAADNSAPREVKEFVEGKGKKEVEGFPWTKLTSAGPPILGPPPPLPPPPPPPPLPAANTSAMSKPTGREILPFGRLKEGGRAKEGARFPPVLSRRLKVSLIPAKFPAAPLFTGIVCSNGAVDIGVVGVVGIVVIGADGGGDVDEVEALGDDATENRLCCRSCCCCCCSC